MAESADVLTGAHQRVILPDLNAGCSMADMANIDQVEEAWDEIAAITAIDRVVPITYMNSSAALKAFVGRNGGAVCTSSNARAVLEWALAKGDKVLFFPDQHLGRNTGFTMGYGEADMRVWNPHQDCGGLEERDVKDATLLLWKGHCSVHQRFRPAHVEAARAEYPGHRDHRAPRMRARRRGARRQGRLDRADPRLGPRRVRRRVDSPIATEIHMVQRLARENPDKTIISLDPLVCPCSTMFRIDAPHLAWVLENLVAGTVVNQIVVDDDTAGWARTALERMLAIT